jgi:hypothetical protein
MNRFCNVSLLLAIVLCGAVLLVDTISLTILLEVLLIASILLCILWWVNKLDDQIHLYRVRRLLRERTLRREVPELPTRRRRFL